MDTFLFCHYIDSLNINIQIHSNDYYFYYTLLNDDCEKLEGHDLVDWQSHHFNSTEELINKVKKLT